MCLVSSHATVGRFNSVTQSVLLFQYIVLQSNINGRLMEETTEGDISAVDRVTLCNLTAQQMTELFGLLCATADGDQNVT